MKKKSTLIIWKKNHILKMFSNKNTQYEFLILFYVIHKRSKCILNTIYSKNIVLIFCKSEIVRYILFLI